MKKWFFTIGGCVLILNAAWFVLLEVRTRRTAELISDPVESHQHRHVSSVSKLPTIEFEHYPEVSVIPETPDAINAPETSEVDELTSEEIDQLLAYADQCCPDDSEVGSSNEERLTWQERLRRRLVNTHGAIPEIDRYIELATIQHDGGTMTVSEVVEHDELAAFLEPSAANDRRLAQTREMASQYGPSASVSVSRTYGGDATPKQGTTVTETIHDH